MKFRHEQHHYGSLNYDELRCQASEQIAKHVYLQESDVTRRVPSLSGRITPACPAEGLAF